MWRLVFEDICGSVGSMRRSLVKWRLVFCANKAELCSEFHSCNTSSYSIGHLGWPQRAASMKLATQPTSSNLIMFHENCEVRKVEFVLQTSLLNKFGSWECKLSKNLKVAWVIQPSSEWARRGGTIHLLQRVEMQSWCTVAYCDLHISLEGCLGTET